ncbi:hypothetical protein DFP72DRAFT_859004 [Ephemerocybe angulata]|uniref:Uncharacterized protein n=1 Tax=Ephemerocybe angulata TaxID=980116 RepID=A0A8H6LW29_9AGAR|nr:hypothetical protein DFP72DRAFT_859004 [Tulosesus angulatus]
MYSIPGIDFFVMTTHVPWANPLKQEANDYRASRNAAPKDWEAREEGFLLMEALRRAPRLGRPGSSNGDGDWVWEGPPARSFVFVDIDIDISEDEVDMWTGCEGKEDATRSRPPSELRTESRNPRPVTGGDSEEVGASQVRGAFLSESRIAKAHENSQDAENSQVYHIECRARSGRRGRTRDDLRRIHSILRVGAKCEPRGAVHPVGFKTVRRQYRGLAAGSRHGMSNGNRIERNGRWEDVAPYDRGLTPAQCPTLCTCRREVGKFEGGRGWTASSRHETSNGNRIE